jgi:hypothetical protein
MGCGEVGDDVLKLGREFALRQAVGCGWKGKRALCSHWAPTGARPGQGPAGLGQNQCICVEGVKGCCWLGRGWGHRHRRSRSIAGAWSPLSASL